MNVSSNDALERLNNLSVALQTLRDGFPSALTELLSDLLALAGGDAAMLLRGPADDAVAAFSTDPGFAGRHFNLSDSHAFERAGFASATAKRLKKPHAAWTVAFASHERIDFERLPEAAVRALGLMLDSMERSEERFAVDALTLLPARTATLARLQEVLSNSERSQTTAALLFIDIDKFKSVNDTFGHARGDDVLRMLAQQMRQTLRAGEFIGRLGGDEFAVILPFVRDVTEAEHTAQRLCDIVCETEQGVSLSVGVALIPQSGDSVEDLLAQADAAMYRAKRAEICYSTALVDERERAEGRSVPLAIGAGDVEKEFLLCFQPIFDSVSGRVARAEALPRWMHPRLGVLAPGDFLRLSSQRTGALDTWALARALERAPAWRIAYNLEQVHVNVRMHDERDLEALTQILKDASPEARSSVSLEVQHVAGGQLPHAINVLAETGVQVGLDSFQAIRLNLLDLSLLKLSFVKVSAAALPAAEYQRVIKAVVGLAKIFHWNVIVTQIERSAESALEEHPGVRYLQGFRFAQPLTAADFEQWLRSGT